MFSCTACKSNYLSGQISKTHEYQPRARRLPEPKKLPLILRCGHTFCESCINKLKEKIPMSSSSQVTNCPALCYRFKVLCPHVECEFITFLRNGLKELPVNIYILSHAEFNIEGTMSKTFDNIISSSSDYGDSSVKFSDPRNLFSPQESKVVQNCLVHDRLIEYYCEEDCTFICSRCYIMGDHKDHTIQSLEERNKPILSDIETELSTAKNVFNQLNSLDKKSSSVFSSLKMDVSTVLASVNQSFMNLHSLLQAREAEMVDSIVTSFKTSINSFENEKLECQNAQKDLKMLLNEAINLLENPASVADGSGVAHKLQQVSLIPCIVPKSKDSSFQDTLRWEEKNLAGLVTAIQSFGSLTGSLSSARLKTFVEAGDDIDYDDDQSVTSENSTLYPSNEVQSFTSQVSQSSADVIIESDSETGSEISASVQAPKEKSSVGFTEKIVMPTLKGAPHQVLVTHINSPSDFFVQLNSNKSKLETLMYNINQWCRKASSSKHIPQSVEKGMHVLSRYGVDKTWYRAEVLDIIKVLENGAQKLRVIYCFNCFYFKI